MTQLDEIERKILYNELHPVWKSISSINYAVIKGDALSCQIYHDTSRRKSNDIDILVSRKNVSFLEKQLQSCGFTHTNIENKNKERETRILCFSYSHQISPFSKVKYGFNLNVDVNYDIFWGEYEGKRCSIDVFLDDCEPINLYGRYCQ